MPIVKECVRFRFEKEECDEEVGGLAAMVTLALALTAPVLAQEGVAATVAMERLNFTTYQYGIYAVTDEESGAFYSLRSAMVDLNTYAGQRVTVYGTLVTGYEYGQIEGGPPIVEVTWVEPAPL